MKAILAILSGLGIGAVLMYFFDPQGGNRRRSLVRDKAVKFNRQTREALEGTAKDLSNRAKGLAHDFKLGMGRNEEGPSDQTVDGWSDGPAM
jgi:hypothetical protein